MTVTLHSMDFTGQQGQNVTFITSLDSRQAKHGQVQEDPNQRDTLNSPD